MSNQPHLPSAGDADYTFTELAGDRRDAFIRAWEHAFDRRLAAEVYDWIFDGRNRLFATLCEGNIAAGYCLYPMEAVVAGANAPVLLCNNVFVAPEHQGKLLFTRLGRYALQTAAAATGAPLAFGIPNAGAVSGHRRVGWSQQSVPFLARPRAAVSPAGSGMPAWTQQPLDDAALKALEACSRRSAAGRGFSVVKTAEFARWRYLSKPAMRYWFAAVGDGATTRAYAVAKYFADRRRLHLLDIDGDDPAAIDALIASIDSVDAPFDHVDLWSTTAHRERFERAGFAASADSSTLIFINPAELRGVAVDSGLNLVLGDNDVY